MTSTDVVVPRFLDRKPLIWTFTMLQTYDDVCPHQAWRRYILRKGDEGHIPYAETPQMKRGNDVHSALEYRVTGNKPLPEDMHDYERFARVFDGKKVRAEPRLAVNRKWEPTGYFDNDCWGRGRADIAIVEETTAYLADWKTGNLRENPFELEVQAVLIKAKFPRLQKIMGQFVWLKDGHIGRLHDLSDTAGTQARISDIVDKIEHDRSRNIFDKKKGPLCGWCDVRDCRHNTKPA